MLDYASLAAVAAVVREGSFEKAARALNVTASAISQRVKQLEERLGGVLIVRGQPCEATGLGQQVCRHVEHVGMLEQELRSRLPGLAASDPAEPDVTLKVAINADSLGTWFIAAMVRFLGDSRALLDVAIDDQDHTHEWLRSGQVLAAVTSDAKPVQGCRSVPLGKLTYVAVASPAFQRRHFSKGVTAGSVARAPSLRFDRKDQLQARWIRQTLRKPVEPPCHWLPSTQAFIDASLAGIGWGMNPRALIAKHLEHGELVELVPGRSLHVPLYWQHTRLQMPMLARLSQAVTEASRTALRH